jgi:hypothetical protein
MCDTCDWTQKMKTGSLPESMLTNIPVLPGTPSSWESLSQALTGLFISFFKIP